MKHRTNRNRDEKRARERARKLEHAVATAAIVEAARPAEGLTVTRAWWGHLMAVGLSLDPHPERARDLMKLPAELVGDDLAIVVKEARDRHMDIIAGKGLSRLARGAAMMSSVYLMSKIDALPPSMLPSAHATNVRTMIESNGGSPNPAFGTITINIRGGAGDKE